MDEQKKVLNHSQKPLAVMKWIITLYTNPEDWILDGLSGTGICVSMYVYNYTISRISLECIYNTLI